MGKKQKPGAELLEVALKSVDALGMDETISVLKNAVNANGIGRNQAIVEFIIAVVCKEFKVPKNELIYGKSHKRSAAIAIVSHLLLRHSNLDQKSVASVLSKKQAAISKHNTFIENLTDSVSYEKDLKVKVVMLNEKIKEYKNQKNSQ